MTTMNVSLSDTLKAFVDEQVDARGYATGSDYVQDLIRKDRDLQRLRAELLDGARSAATAPVSPDYFRTLRNRVTQPGSP